MAPPDTAARLPAPPPLSDDCALFLDVDGCLLEFADDPSSVRADASLLASLEAASRRLGGALALVSGRSVASLDSIFAPSLFAAAGLHGLERRDHPGGQAMGEVEQAALDATRWSDVVAEARARLAGHAGARVEDKGRTLALHWRAAPPAEDASRGFAAWALPRLPGYVLQPGSNVLELRPAGADKGAAIAAFLGLPPFAGRRPVFAGDDLTDEHGFALVNARAGISIVVGDRRPTQARHGLADPAALRRWLGHSTHHHREASA